MMLASAPRKKDRMKGILSGFASRISTAILPSGSLKRVSSLTDFSGFDIFGLF
jgi:hypothetical protein